MTEEITEHPIAITIISGLYITIFISGIIGNLLIILIVFKNRNARTITNFFIANLSLSCLLMTSLNVPMTPISIYMKHWIFGGVVCSIVPITAGVAVYVTTMTSCVIAMDRFWQIVMPLMPRMRPRTCGLIIVCIWLIALLISLPLFIYQRIGVVAIFPNGTAISMGPRDQFPDGFDYPTLENVSKIIEVCNEMWPDQGQPRKIYSLIGFCLQFLLPGFLIAICYWRVSVRLSQRLVNRAIKKTPRIGTANNSVTLTDKEQNDLIRKRRTNRMLILMVIVLYICWIPQNILLLIDDNLRISESWQFFRLAFFSVHILAMSSAVFNPMIYGFMNENFTRELYKMIPRRVTANRTAKQRIPNKRGIETAASRCTMDLLETVNRSERAEGFAAAQTNQTETTCVTPRICTPVSRAPVQNDGCTFALVSSNSNSNASNEIEHDAADSRSPENGKFK